MEQFLEGFFLQASLILALGAQNLFVLESGLRKRRHLFVALLCTLCDALLISLGVLGAATIFVQVPWIKILFGALGVSFLAFYGFLKLVENPEIKIENSTGSASSMTVVLGQTLAFSLLNPHVYLDTIILIGGYSTQFPNVFQRSLFGMGASSFSFLWFFGLALFAAAMSRYMKSRKVMKAISLVSGVVLLSLAVKLGIDVWNWYEKTTG